MLYDGVCQKCNHHSPKIPKCLKIFDKKPIIPYNSQPKPIDMQL